MSLRADQHAEEFWTPDARPDTASTGSALFTDAVRMRPELLERVRMEHEARTAAAPQRVQRLPAPAGGRPRPIVRGSVVSEVLGDVKPAKTGASFVPEPKAAFVPEPNTRAFRDSFEEFEPAETDAPFVTALKTRDLPTQKEIKVFDAYYTDEFTPPIVLASWKREPASDFKAENRADSTSYVTSERPGSAVYNNEAFNDFTKNSMTGETIMQAAVALEMKTYGDNKFTTKEPSDIMGMSMSMPAGGSSSAQEVSTILDSDVLKAALKLQNETNFKKGFLKGERETALKNMKPYLMPPLSKVVDTVPEGNDMFSMMAVLPTVTSTTPKLKLYVPHEMQDGRSEYVTDFSFYDLPDVQVESIFGARVVPVAIKNGEPTYMYGHTLWLARRAFGAYKKELAHARGDSDQSKFEDTVKFHKKKGLGDDVANFINVGRHYVELADDGKSKWLMPVVLAYALSIEETGDDGKNARNALLRLARAPVAWQNKSQEELINLVEAGPGFPTGKLEPEFLKKRHTDLMSLWTATMLVSTMESTQKFDKVLKSGKLYQAKREIEKRDAKKAAKEEAKRANDVGKVKVPRSAIVMNKLKGMWSKSNSKAESASSVADLLDALAEEKLGPLQFDERPVNELVERML